MEEVEMGRPCSRHKRAEESTQVYGKDYRRLKC
jgi:hypothetical protein